MNNRIMPKWSEVKDVNGINLHLFDAVQVITSGNKRHIHNVLEYADRMTGDEQYEFLTEMLDGTIGLSDREIRNLCWN